jgi:hypothetical protein
MHCVVRGVETDYRGDVLLNLKAIEPVDYEVKANVKTGIMSM